jgi:hypothetical protein
LARDPYVTQTPAPLHIGPIQNRAPERRARNALSIPCEIASLR